MRRETRGFGDRPAPHCMKQSISPTCTRDVSNRHHHSGPANVTALLSTGSAQYESELTTSPPAMVLRAHQVLGLMVALMNRTEPSIDQQVDAAGVAAAGGDGVVVAVGVVAAEVAVVGVGRHDVVVAGLARPAPPPGGADGQSPLVAPMTLVGVIPPVAGSCCSRPAGWRCRWRPEALAGRWRTTRTASGRRSRRRRRPCR